MRSLVIVLALSACTAPPMGLGTGARIPSARSGDSVAISAYLGNGKVLGEAMTEFAALYADQNERDHAEAVARWFDGRAPTPAA